MMKRTTFIKHVAVICFVFMSSSLCLGYEAHNAKGIQNNFGALETATNLPYNLPLTEDFTVMAKIRININNSTLFSWSNEKGEVFSSITITDDYKLRFSIPAINYSIDSHTSLESGCHHVAVVCDRGRVTLYINGEEEISTQINLAELAHLMGQVNIKTILGNLATSEGFDISEFALFEDPLVKALIHQYMTTPPIITVNAEIGLLLAINYDMEGMPWEGLAGNWVADVCLDITLSSEDLEKDTLSVYPNPASNYVKVSKNSIDKPYRIYDILGKELMSSKVDQSRTIDISVLNKGVYFLSIDNRHSVKFLKK